ncbi:HET domain containing protein [Pyrenophora tritici-repentis]|uniref:HET domain containing protein n=1 Tax=Pyrenophora tritici-repentis TaxID=45151 RepID=A0A2W1GI86_9PLEO|nr:HET domain-containing protein [Pyrenophora tritici-repentis]KAF7569015.1 HET domain containing protein [Pyrenophora tritici-repentis]KAG9383180.1 HET domain containing protein [Pyrenophora tritici-repentis]KAI1668110.1 Heterokaryon incompatibility protein [Pyrenophora tritici-repentis]KAI1681173.1 Heterokaryon incompatibility protein [Pyrenophora tritici-repentis]
MVSVCVTCKGLQKNHLRLDGAQGNVTKSLPWVDTTLPNLRLRSTSCRACALLLNGILLHHDRFASVPEDRIRVTAGPFQQKPEKGSQGPLPVELRWQDSDEDSEEQLHAAGHADLKLEFFTDMEGQSPFSAIGRGRHITENPLQTTGLSTARSLVKNCLETHGTCGHPGKPTALPKRVLDLSPGGDDPKSIRLHESEYIHEERGYQHGEYVALSHVWGVETGIPKTTLATLDSHKKSISWAALPRSYQEAIFFTRALGCRWLFIDSLCLVQDDLQEKLEDSLKMGEIFGNAFLTLAATSASDSSSQPLLPAKTPPFKIQTTDNKGSLYKINVREQPSHYSFEAPFDGNSHMNEWELPFNMTEEANLHTPLLTRAWPYTERLLSPRVLHFTKSEMILECWNGYQCECGRIDDNTCDSRPTDQVKRELARVIADTQNRPQQPNGSGNGTNGHARLDSVTSQLASTNLTNGALQDFLRRREEALQLWSYIITEYTARHLTYDSDRLIAIASIAKALSPTLQSGYIAGQWTFSTLGLLWYPNETTKCRRPQGQNVPSWSWASVEGSPIFFDNSSAMDLACRASFGPKGKRASAWSPIMGEPLELSGAMAAEVVFHSSGGSLQDEASYILARNGMTAEFIPDVSPPHGDDALQDGDTLVVVLVSMTFRTSIVGIVLKPWTGNNVYRRVGRFECYECTPEGSEQEMSEDAEALFEHWFPDIQDMTQLDNYPQRTFTVV